MPTEEEINAFLAAVQEPLRSEYIEAGAGIPSENSEAQAEQTLNAHARYKDLVEQYGFDAEDAALLLWLLNALRVCLALRSGVQLGGKTGTQDQRARIKAGKATRMVLRALAESIQRKRRAAGDFEAGRAIGTVLGATLTSADKAKALAGQLESLADVIAKYGAGDAPSVALARTQAAALRAAEAARAVPRGTPEETARLDQLDGMVAELVRAARKAARAAARATGNAAIEQAYALDRLYR